MTRGNRERRVGKWDSQDARAYAEKSCPPPVPQYASVRSGTPAAFGFVEWNGRSLTDSAPDVMFSIASNTPVHLGIGKESVTSKPSMIFPYVPAVQVEEAVAA